MKTLTLLVAGLVCMCSIPCPKEPGHVCLHAFIECPCPRHGPPIGYHSHSTHYIPHYTEQDLTYNRTRYSIRRMLEDALRH